MSAELYKQDVQEGDNAVHFPDSYAENLSEGGEMISAINGETDRVVGMYTQIDSEGEISTANVNRLGEEGGRRAGQVGEEAHQA